MRILSKQKIVVAFVGLVLAFGAGFMPVGTMPLVGRAAAACLTTAPPTTYGQVTQSINVTTAGTYRVWSRIKAPDTTNNSYYFQVDSGGCAYDVGDSSSIPANTWTWVNYQDGNTASPIDVTLTAGAHTLIYTGKEPDVLLDKVMLLTDTSCVPVDTATTYGDNCAVSDATGPTTSVTSPTAGATVSGRQNIIANATDSSGVKSVDVYVDGTKVGSAAPGSTGNSYTYSWDSTLVPNGSHSIYVIATDNNANTTQSSSVTVNVSNASDSKPTVSLTDPTAGHGLTIGTKEVFTVTATDNVGVSKVELYSGSNLVATLDTTGLTSPYSLTWDTTGVAVGTYSITAKAYDTANQSTTSSAVSIAASNLSLTNGDTNGDGRVNALDLSAVLTYDGKDYPAADFKTPYKVGGEDGAVVIGHWTW